MSSATSPYPLPGISLAPARAADLTVRLRAMASEVTLLVCGPVEGAPQALERAAAVFERVERACTRFDPSSPLMLANAEPDSWHEVPAELFEAVREAHAAYLATGGLFDPRVLRALESIGYDRSLPFAAGSVETSGSGGTGDTGDTGDTDDTAGPGGAPWVPGFDATGRRLKLGPEPIDLGGIGKGLAVRWAGQELAGAGWATLVEAGGDCSLAGDGPDGDGWRVAVEDPRGGTEPVAVLAISDSGCATSSIRLRRWRSAGQDVHHLIDPRTGRPGGPGLLSVTVAGPDVAMAEVWSKSLFLTGADRIAEQAESRSLAAFWVREDGSAGCSAGMAELVVWRSADAG